VSGCVNCITSKEYIEHILFSTGGDKEKAAEALKVNLSTLYRKLSDDKPENSQE
jgi:DNA-binding NtrC family response regulator